MINKIVMKMTLKTEKKLGQNLLNKLTQEWLWRSFSIIKPSLKHRALSMRRKPEIKMKNKLKGCWNLHKQKRKEGIRKLQESLKWNFNFAFNKTFVYKRVF